MTDTAPTNLRRRGPPISSDSPVARRARAYRRRRRERVRILQIEIADDDLDGFIDLGILASDQRDDCEAIIRALATLCRLGCRHWPEKAR